MRVLSDGSVTTPRGFRAGAVYCGLKTPGEDKLDLGLLVSERPGPVAATFTTNKVAAAPVLLDRQRVAGGRAQAVVFNAGNANACTGEQGLADAREMQRFTADTIGGRADQYLVMSTGVIGVPLPMWAVRSGILGTTTCSCRAWAPSPTTPRPSRVAVYRLVVLPSDAPPTWASWRSSPSCPPSRRASRHRAWLRAFASMGGRPKSPFTSIAQPGVTGRSPRRAASTRSASPCVGTRASMTARTSGATTLGRIPPSTVPDTEMVLLTA